MSSLEDELGATVPAAVAALPAADLARLCSLVQAAKVRQHDDLEAAFDATVKYVPFPMRPIAKKMLRG